MIYLTSMIQDINIHWQNSLNEIEIKILKAPNDIHNITVTKNDILILNLDYFDNIQNILDFYNQLPKELKIITIRKTTNLVEGTLLIKKGIKSYCNVLISQDIIPMIIDTVKAGNTWIYPQLMNYIISQVNVGQVNSNTDILKALTSKEEEISKLVASGNSNKEISEILDIAVVTVKKHIGHIFEKLDVKDRVSLAILVNS